MDKLLQKLTKNSPEPKLIEDAFEFAKKAYQGKQGTLVGSRDYVQHSLRVTTELDKMGLDPKTIAAGLLHDAADELSDEAREYILNEIRKKFGKDISYLIERLSALDKVRYSLKIKVEEKNLADQEKAENLRKMFLALAQDLRVVLIELVSRLDNLEGLHELSPEGQKSYATENMQIFVPLANRLGLGEIRRKMEDICFYYLGPERYKWLEQEMKEKYEEREKRLKKLIPILKKLFKSERVRIVEINSRTKSYWSTYQKLVRKDMDLEKIHDLLAIRVIVDDVSMCYKALGAIHKKFLPVSGEINDYIAKPKPNGYRSLHTSVFYEENKICEMQIRTPEMHREAEYGVCAHWSYKEKINLQKDEDKFDWVHEVPEFWRTFKINFFTNQVFAFTPKGDLIVLPKGSTPVDFAYAVHSEIGNHCETAKIKGKIVPLSEVLQNGDVVEIVVNKKRKPSTDWLGFVKTNFARSHIKKETEKTSLFTSTFKIPAAIPGFIKRKVFALSEKIIGRKPEQAPVVKKEKKKELYLAGQKDVAVTYAKCCNPGQNDQVKAYLTARKTGAVLHKNSCSQFQKLAKKFPEKIVDASWQES